MKRSIYEKMSTQGFVSTPKWQQIILASTDRKFAKALSIIDQELSSTDISDNYRLALAAQRSRCLWKVHKPDEAYRQILNYLSDPKCEPSVQDILFKCICEFYLNKIEAANGTVNEIVQQFNKGSPDRALIARFLMTYYICEAHRSFHFDDFVDEFTGEIPIPEENIGPREPPDSSNDANDWVQYGEFLFKIGLYEEADEVFSKAHSLDKTNIRAYKGKLQIIKNIASPEKIFIFNKWLVNKFPDEPDFLFELVFQLLDRKDFKEAERCLNSFLKRNKDNSEAWGLLGSTYHDYGKTNDSIKAHQKATKYNPLHISAWNELGELYFKQKKNEKSIHAFLQVMNALSLERPMLFMIPTLLKYGVTLGIFKTKRELYQKIGNKPEFKRFHTLEP